MQFCYAPMLYVYEGNFLCFNLQLHPFVQVVSAHTLQIVLLVAVAIWVRMTLSAK